MDCFRIFFGLPSNFNKYEDFISDTQRETKGVYRFGAFKLDAAERRLWCDDKPISLAPKQFDLLVYFVENAGRTAKKTDLLDEVWTDTYVEETTLARNVSWLRKTIGEHADGRSIIETVPKLGYRFTAEVTRSDTDENTLIVEEQTIQRFRGEETVTIDDAEMWRRGNAQTRRLGDAENKLSILPNVAAPPRLRVPASSFLLIAFGLIALAGIGFIVYQNYFQNRATKAIVPSRVVPFSGALGYENSPAFSPDGKLLAYSWNGGEGDNSDIYVKIIGAGEALQLTKTDANEQYPTFSPDGKYIAFVRGKYGVPGEVIIIPSLGGRERSVARLYSGNYSISYSPDGQNITVVDTENSTEDGQYAVYVINIETGRRRRVTAPAEFMGETTPRFSPDGKSIAFIRVAKEYKDVPFIGKQDLFIVPASGGEARQLTFDGAIINSLAWSGDGEYIYFVPVSLPRRTIIRRIPFGGGEQEIVSTGGSDITNIAVSPDGSKIVFAEDVQHWSIRRVTSDGQKAEKFGESKANELFPQFSPDNSHVVFESDLGGIAQIWMADREGKNLRQITDMPYWLSSPQFSPDGSMIAFNMKTGEEFANFIIPTQGGTPRRISPEDVKEDFPVWSADGKYIYFSSTRGGEGNIWRMNGDGNAGDAVQITTNGALQAAPAPDGSTVFFTKTDFPNELWRVPAEGGAEEPVPEFAAAGFFSTWTMGKTSIYFLAQSSDKTIKLKIYNLARGQITDAPGDYKIPPNLNGSFIAADGKILLCSVIEKYSRLMIAELP